MTSEIPFRIALIVVIVLTMAVTLYYRRQAASSGETISHQEEGHLFTLFLRLTSLCLWISTLGYLLVPAWLAWA